MAKFEGLTNHLAKQTLTEIILSFGEIEAISGVELEKSASRPQYWANLKKPKQMRGPNKAAREAGYFCFLLSGQDKVRFIKV